MSVGSEDKLESHQFPNELAGHFHCGHQHQHIEQELADIVPDHGGRGEGFIDGGRGCAGEFGENHAGQDDDTALQADGGVAFYEGQADVAGGFSTEGRQGYGRNGGGDIELEKSAVYCQNHHNGQCPHQERPQQCHRPQGDAFQEAHILNEGCHLLR